MIDTSETLLDRLKIENAHDAWEEFFKRYWHPILAYGRKLGLSASEAEDVLQETMVTLMQLLPRFAYDKSRGRFRNFLLTIVHRKALRCFKTGRRNAAVQARLAESVASEGACAETIDDEAVRRWRESLLEEAVRRIEHDERTDESTFAIFKAYAIDGQSVESIAAEFNVTPNAIYQIRNRLKRRIQAEVRRLERDSGSQEGKGS